MFKDINLAKIYWFICQIIIIAYFIYKWDCSMETEILVALIGLIGIVVLDIISNARGWKKVHNQLGVNKNERSISTQLGIKDNNLPLSEQLGVNSQSLTDQLGVVSLSLTEQIGVNNNSKSLTGQHSDLMLAVHNETELTNKIYNDFNDERRKQHDRYAIFTQSEHNTKQKLDEFKLFMEDWENKISENTKLLQENDKLEFKNNKLSNEVNELKAEISSLKQTINIYGKQIQTLNEENTYLKNRPKNKVSKEEHSKSDYDLEL